MDVERELFPEEGGRRMNLQERLQRILAEHPDLPMTVLEQCLDIRFINTLEDCPHNVILLRELLQLRRQDLEDIPGISDKAIAAIFFAIEEFAEDPLKYISELESQKR